MTLGRVVGTVVTSVSHPFYRGRKQLIVRTLLPDGSYDGTDYVVAIDLVGAGPGEVVLVKDEGNSARQILDTDANGPVRSLIVGIVDQINHS